MRGLRFEHQRFWRTPKNIVVLLITALALLSFILFNTWQDSRYWGLMGTRYPELVSERSLINRTYLSSIRNEIQSLRRSSTEGSEDLERLDRDYDFYRDHELHVYQLGIIARDYTPQHSEQKLEMAITRDRHLLAGLQRGYSLFNETPGRVNQRIVTNQYILDNNVQPPNSPHEMTGINFINQLFSYPWMMIIIAALAMLNIDMFSGDIDYGAYKILYSQPVQRYKIYALKYLVRIVNSLLMVTGLVMLAFVLVSCINGLGDPAYPMGYFSDSFRVLTPTIDSATDTLTFLPWTDYMLRLLPMYLLLCLFTITVVGTVSLLLNNTANTLSSLIALLFMDTVFRAIFSSGSLFYTLWPLAALDINQVFQGALPLSAGAYWVMLVAVSILLFSAGLIILQRRDMTGGMGE